MFMNLFRWARKLVIPGVQVLPNRLWSRTKPPIISLPAEGIHDLARSKPQLVIENTLLRQQLIVLNRSVKRPQLTNRDRGLFILLASRLPSWREALLIIKPATVLRWHRQGFGLFWKRKSRAMPREPKIPAATIALIREMAANNRLWGAERIQGELRKLHIRVAKRAVQRYIRQTRPPRPHGQTWATFLRNHAADIWACDVLQATDVFFRPFFAFFITDLGSRRIVHVGVIAPRRTTGLRSDCGRRRPWVQRRRTSFATTTRSTDPISPPSQREAGSRCSARRSRRHRRMRSVNGCWGACAARASITC